MGAKPVSQMTSEEIERQRRSNREYMRRKRAANPEAARAADKKWRADNPERLAAIKRREYRAHRLARLDQQREYRQRKERDIIARNRSYYQRNKDTWPKSKYDPDYQREYRAKNLDERREADRRYYAANREKVLARRRILRAADSD